MYARPVFLQLALRPRGSTSARRIDSDSSSFGLEFKSDRSFAARGLKGKTQGKTPCDSSFLPPLTGSDDDRISQWAFDLLEALPNAHYNAFVYVLALLREVLAKSWQTTAATRLAAVARDAFLPNGEPDARAHVFSAVQFLLTSNL